jgi:uncharacterized protein YjbJ (UPF0337 family)
MNRDIFEGKFHEVKGAMQAKWGALTGNDLAVVEGNHEQIFGLLQMRYGLMREDAEEQLEELLPRGS